MGRGIPATTPPKTLVDLAAVADEPELAPDEAGVRQHTTPAQVEAVLARRHAWEQDRRYTYGDVLENLQLMMAELRALIPTYRLTGSTASPS